MTLLQCKKSVYRSRKQGQGKKEEFWTCKDAVTRTKACLGLTLVGDIKGNAGSFYHCFGSRRLNKENMGLLMKKII